MLPSPPMRAVYCATLGGDDPLANLAVGDQPEPEVPPGWALVHVGAAALNHHDLWTLKGVSSRKLEPPQILGCDAAGTVERLGDGVPAAAPQPGSRVVVHSVISCGVCAACLAGEPVLCRTVGILSEPPYGGALAELVAVPAANLIPLPDGVGFELAACLPTAYLTAYRMLFVKGGLQPGMSMLVHGAGGGVATAALLLARAAGITAYATSRDAAKREFALSLGAADAFPADADSTKALLRRTGGGVDAVLETVGEPTWEMSLRAVRPGGTVVVAGATAGPNPPAQLHRIFWRHITVAGTSMGTRQELERLVGMVAAGSLKPLIGAEHPLADCRAAFAALAAGESAGKIVVTV
jgi:NADPH:quinone reductase-like Zn-dependent oxidoreductase